jgi:hypothetical protein
LQNLSAFIFKSRTHTISFFVLVALLLVYIGIEAQDRDDYFIYISGARDLFKGDNIYTNIYNSWYHYLYSVFFAILLYPLSLLPFYLSKLIWLCASVYFLYRIFILVFSYFDLSSFTAKNKNLFILFSSLFCIRFINDNFHCGQITIFMLYLCLQGLALIENKKIVWGALLIALGINIKIMPIVLLPYLLYRKKSGAAALIVLFSISFIFIPSLFIGHARNMDLLKTWWGMMNPQNSEHILDVYERSFHSLSTFFATYFADTKPDPYGYGTKINIASLGVEKLGWLINGARLALMAGTLFFLRTLPFKNVTGNLHRLWEVSYLLAVVPLIFPHQHHYSFVFFLPATTYVLYYLFSSREAISKNRFNFIFISMLLVFICFNLQLLIGAFRPFLEHFKVITFGAIYFLFILAFCPPKASRS